MRKQLGASEGQRKKFQAIFMRFGKRVNYKGRSETTVLFTNIIDLSANKRVADHLWFSYTLGFEKVNLTEGASYEFEARIKKYSKGYVNKKYGIDQSKSDYKLSHPTKITSVQSPARS